MLVLESERHPGDLQYYHPIAVARGMIHGELQETSTYPASPYGQDPVLPDASLHLAEVVFKISASWVKIAGKALFTNQEIQNELPRKCNACLDFRLKRRKHTTFVQQWLFWTRRFEEITKSRYASEEVMQLAVDCAEHMTGISIASLVEVKPLSDNDRDGIRMGFRQRFPAPPSNRHTVRDHIAEIREERNGSQIVKADAYPQTVSGIQSDNGSQYHFL